MKRPVVTAAVVLAVLGATGIAGWSWATSWAPSAVRYQFQGVDLGEDAAALDWGAVKAAGAQFAYLVATAGTDRRARSFEANWSAAAEAGLRRGAVHRYSLCRPAIAQADAFNTMVPRDPAALPAAVEVAFDADCPARPDRDALVGDLARFMTLVETHTRSPVLLRVDAQVEAQYRLSAALPAPIWAVADFFTPSYPARPWRLWRASDMRRIEGVEGPVNWDVVAP